jgi:hypothetical protein
MRILRLPGGWEGTLTVLLIASVGMNFLLIKRVGHLAAVNELIKAEGRLNVGDSVPTFEAKTPDGETVAVSYRKPTILYILRPDCVWCVRNTANINVLARAVESSHDFFGVSLSSANLSAHVLASGYTFPILEQLPVAAAIAMKLGGTPQTLLVSSEGKIIRSWAGAFAGPTADEIENYFGVRLPGIGGSESAKADLVPDSKEPR